MTEPEASAPASRALLICLAYFAVAVALSVWLILNGREQILVNVAQDRLQCLSYSPPGEEPIFHAPATLERVRADLLKLVPYTDCVRTYAVDNGMEYVPAVARELGLKVLLGAWIGRDLENNALQIDRVIEIANSYPDVVRAVIVGNEVLLRRDQPEEILREYIRNVRSRVNAPVTYADVWEFWMRHRDIAQDVAFVTVHMLPYWEDHPIPVENSVGHITHVFEVVQKAFPDHRIMIGEAGWPSQGRQRAGAVPSRVNQARFIREFTVAADHHKFEYNLIEAFDQPWKRAMEGTVGGEWGLMDVDGELKVPLTGPVQNLPQWYVPLLAGCVGLVAGLIYGLRRYASRSWAATSVVALAAFSTGVCLVLQWWMLDAANRNAREWFGSVLWAVSGWTVFVSATLLVADWLARVSRPVVVPSVRSVMASAGGGQTTSGVHTLLGLSRLVFLFCLSYMCVLLTLDPRYRDIPLLTIVLPTVALTLCAWIAHRRPVEPANRAAEEVVLACWLVAASVWIGISEGLANVRALTWCLLCVLLAGGVVWSDWRSRERKGAEQQADTRQLDPI